MRIGYTSTLEILFELQKIGKEEHMTDYELISKNRTVIMGIAALWIMIFHGTINTTVDIFSTLIKIGYLGVDIFMFMSGFSMEHSYNQTCALNPRSFYKKRMKKILPTFVPFGILWIVGYLHDNYPTKELLLQGFHTKEFWITMVTFRWFVPCIIFCYFVTPLVDAFIKRLGHKLSTLLLMVIPILAFSILFIGSSVALMFLIRIPEYIIGYYYAGNPERKSNGIIRTVLVFLEIVIYYYLVNTFSDEYLCDTGLYWYLAVFCTSSMVLCIAYVGKILENRVINFMGNYSLELFLLHVYFMFSIFGLAEKFGLQLDRFNLCTNIFSIIFACAVSWIYSKIIAFAMSKIENYRRR